MKLQEKINKFRHVVSNKITIMKRMQQTGQVKKILFEISTQTDSEFQSHEVDELKSELNSYKNDTQLEKERLVAFETGNSNLERKICEDQREFEAVVKIEDTARGYRIPSKPRVVPSFVYEIGEFDKTAKDTSLFTHAVTQTVDHNRENHVSQILKLTDEVKSMRTKNEDSSKKYYSKLNIFNEKSCEMTEQNVVLEQSRVENLRLIDQKKSMILKLDAKLKKLKEACQDKDRLINCYRLNMPINMNHRAKGWTNFSSNSDSEEPLTKKNRVSKSKSPSTQGYIRCFVRAILCIVGNHFHHAPPP